MIHLGFCVPKHSAILFITLFLCRFVVSCIPSWFWGPVVTLEDCLAAFFAADELKGEFFLCYLTAWRNIPFAF